MPDCSFLSRDWKTTVKSFLSVMVIFFALFISANNVCAEITIRAGSLLEWELGSTHRNREPLRLGEFKTFTATAHRDFTEGFLKTPDVAIGDAIVSAGIKPDPKIGYIEFSATGGAKKSFFSKLTDHCQICKSRLTHSVKFKWDKPSGLFPYTVTAKVFDEDGNWQDTVTWEVQVGELTFEPLPDLPSNPAIPDPPTVQVWPEDGTYRPRVGDDMNFEVRATSDDGIASIEFLRQPSRGVPESIKIKDSFFRSKQFLAYWPSLKVEHTWETFGVYTMIARITTKAGVQREVKWRINVRALNQPPIRINPEGLTNLGSLVVGGTPGRLEVSEHFRDLEGGNLYFDDARINPATLNIVTLKLLGNKSVIEIEPRNPGRAVFSVIAREPDGLLASQTFVILVEGHQKHAPGAVGTIPAQTLTINETALPLDASVFFRDPNGDTLDYKATSSSTSVAIVQSVGSQLRIWPLSVGTTTITVTATDPSGFSAEQTFNVTVTAAVPTRNQPPGTVGTIPAQSLTTSSASLPLDASVYFRDPDNDRLDYAAVSSDPTVATTQRVGSQITILPQGIGIAAITVTATDPKGLSAEQAFNVTVTAGISPPGQPIPHRPPEPVPQSFDLAIKSFKVSKNTLDPSESFTLSITIHNNGPGNSPGPILSYYHSFLLGFSTTDPPQLQGTVSLGPLASGESTTRLISLAAPATPKTYYYGAWLAANTGDTDLTNDVANEVGVTVIVNTTEVPKPELSAETWMPDANLRAKVREALGIAPGDALTQEAMQGLTELHAPPVLLGEEASKKISDLTGLEHATQLTTLDLSYHAIVDVSPLSGLIQLTELDLLYNAIADVSPLSGLTQLTTLNLALNEIVDIGPLSSLTQLTELWIRGNEIVDVSPLSGLTQLTELGLSGNEVSNLRPLSGLTQLTELWIRGPADGAFGLRGNLSDISVLSGLTRLTALYLGGNEIADVSPLSGLTQLTTLELHNNEVIDLRPLSSLTQLTSLSLPGNKIININPLAGLTQLRFLQLQGNEIVEVGPLSGLTQLIELYLRGNPIADLTPLRRLKAKNPNVKIDIDINAVTTAVSEEIWMPDVNLRAAVRKGLGLAPDAILTREAMQRLTKLDASIWGVPASEKISDLTGLEHATQLKTLVLFGNKVVNVSALSDLAQLTWLTLYDNEMVDVSGLSNLTQVTTLLLSYNEIVDVSPLADLTQLTRLELRGNKISNVSALEGLINLEHLNLSENSIADLTPLRRLKAKNPNVKIDIDLSIEIPIISDGVGVYWTLFDRGEIQRSNLDGTSVRTLFTKLSHPADIAVDIASEKIYWSTFLPYKIQRANLDGTNVQDIVTNELLGPAHIALDVAGGKIYWTNDDDGNGDEKIQRANLDGTNVEDLVTNEELSYLNGIALDVTRGKIYWTDKYKIQRANLDGTNVEDIFVNSASPRKFYNLFGLALDVAGGKVYWGNPSKSKIQRANLDGTNVQDLIIGVEPYSIALDVAGGKVYWSDLGKSKIQRANLDGSNVEDIVTGVKGRGIALDTFSQNPPPVVPVVREDVNRDGVIDLQDTAVVRANLGQTGQNDADVNGDNVVDVDDLVLVLAAIENAAAAPTTRTQIQQLFTTKEVQQWLTEVQLSEDTSPAYLRGITMLEQILALLIPQETALLANYPNPFNPETWIPYQLSKPTDVTLSIYSVDGRLVRTLVLGHQPAGVYQRKSRAAYWDGRNNVGERVASGVYFYTFTAGDFTATRKMLIRK